MKKKSKGNKKKKFVLHGHINGPTHVIPGMDQFKVDLMDVVFGLLAECNFDLDEFNRLVDTIPTTLDDPDEREWAITNQIPLYKETAKGMREEAIRRGLIKE